MNVVGKALDELYRMFDIINKERFDNQLPEPVITIQKTRSDCYGHFSLDKIWRDKNNIVDGNIAADENDEESYYEINIDPRFFCERSAIEIGETLVHEMVHYMNKINGIKDCNQNNHNKKFKESAEAIGLVCERSKKFGWGITSLGDELQEFMEVVVMPEDAAFEYFRTGAEKQKPKKKRKKNIFTYTCPQCGTTAKAKMDVNIMCGDCKVLLEMEEIEEEVNDEAELDNNN